MVSKGLKQNLKEWGLFEISKVGYSLIKRLGINVLSLIQLCERKNKKREKLTVGIMDAGGFGDVLMELPLIEKIRAVVGESKCCIVCCNKYSSFFGEFVQIDRSVQYTNDIKSLTLLYAACDLVLIAGKASHIMTVTKFDRNRVKRFSERLYEYCIKNIAFQGELFGDGLHNYRVDQYGILMGKHRIEFFDMQGVLGVSRNDVVPMPELEEAGAVLDKFGLVGKEYIAINRDAGCGDDKHPKLWLREYYIELMKLIKKQYPDKSIVLVGGKTDDGLTAYADVDTTGKTSLQELAVILKHSALLIAGEGGPVHLQHFLGGKSLVIFGPTDLAMFGYSENINISSDICNRQCCWLVDNWTDGCIKNKENPDCMRSIKPAMVIKEITMQFAPPD